MEILLARLLRIGVSAAAAVTAAGLALLLWKSGRAPADYHVFRGNASSVIPSRVWDGQATSAGRAVIMIGVLILIATPVARVAFAAVAFARERDRLYAGIALFVLAVLGLSLLGLP